MPDPISGVIAGGAILGSSYMSSKASKDAAKAQGKAADASAQVQWDMFNQQREDYAPYRETGTQALYSLADLYGIRRPLTFKGDTDKGVGKGVTIQGSGWASKAAQLAATALQAGKGATSASGGSPSGEVAQWTDPAKARQQAMAGFYESPGYQFRQDEARKAVERSAAARGMLNSGASLKALTQYSQGIASDEFNNYANRLASLAGVGQTATNSLAQLGANTAGNVSNALMQKGNARASGYIGQANAWNNGINQGIGLFTLGQGGFFG